MNQNVMIKNKADQVVSRITDWLKNGRFSVGDKLPPERQLAATLGVSLLTVNKAMSRLEDAALLSRSAGKGTHVINLPSPDTVAVICDIVHMTKPRHPSFVDLLIEGLLKSAKQSGIIPHFWIGQGRSPEDFLDSLGFRSAAWNNIRGVIAMAWRAGLEEILEERHIPLVTICTKHLGKNSIVMDYEELGRMGAAELAKDRPETVYVVYNDDFDRKYYNSPLAAFVEESRKGGLSADRIRLISSEVTPEAGFRLGTEIGPQARHIFFTDENICTGFHQWEQQHPQFAMPNRRLVTQATPGIGLDLPSYSTRFAFMTEDICNQSIAMLNDLFQSHGQDGLRKVAIRPVQCPSHHPQLQ